MLAGALALLLLSLPCPVAGETLTFDRVRAAAEEKSLDLAILEAEVRIRRGRLAEEGAAYYPTLGLRLNDEYFHDLGANGETTAIGDTVISGAASTYQHSLTVSAGYELLDFGARRGRVEGAGHALDQAAFDLEAARRQLALDILDLYCCSTGFLPNQVIDDK